MMLSGARLHRCITAARNIVYPSVRGRTGYGSFRLHEKLDAASLELVRNSDIIDRYTWRYEHEWPLPFPPTQVPFSTYRSVAEGALIYPQIFYPHEVWILFWALVKSEHQFISNDVPQGSHEERLSGSLVARLREGIRETCSEWSTSSDPGSPICEILYADIASQRREKDTGADLALILRCRYSWHPEFFKVVRFQAKKADGHGNAIIDQTQVEALVAEKSLGYHLFYPQTDEAGWVLPPTVVASSMLRLPRKKRARSRTLRFNSFSTGWDFAAFVAFAMASPGSAEGRLTASEDEAIRLAFTPTLPAHLAIVTVGRGQTANPRAVDWANVILRITDQEIRFDRGVD